MLGIMVVVSFFALRKNYYYFCDYNTNMVENKKEIEARRKQYEYYREKLLKL